MSEMSFKTASDVKQAGFWVSQLCVIVATVLGVFLAANQGYKQAINFENALTYKDTYYVQQSMKYELEDNIIKIQEYIKKAKNPAYGIGAKSEPLNLNSLVWENMKFSPATLGVNPDFLRLAQNFYNKINVLHSDVANNKLGTNIAFTQMEKEISTLQNELFPKIDSNNVEIKKILDKNNIIL